ncbi:MAG: VOC family protein [Pseudomonadota bacterium]
MTKSLADPPALVPELYVTDLKRSLGFYGDILGFNVLFRREAEGFAYLERESAHLMLEELDSASRKFVTADIPPFGRGLNLQIRVADVDDLHRRVISAGLELIIDLEDRWYPQLKFERGNRQFVVADPDGYLLRFYSDLGTRASNAITE